MLARRVLSKEEESQSTDAEVTREDQDKINRFSSLHNRVKLLEAECEVKKKDKEDLEELSTELELMLDENELVQYKIGDAFYALPLSEAQDRLSKATEETEAEISRSDEEVSEVRKNMNELKAHLYARFGRGINLEA